MNAEDRDGALVAAEKLTGPLEELVRQTPWTAMIRLRCTYRARRPSGRDKRPCRIRTLYAATSRSARRPALQTGRV